MKASKKIVEAVSKITILTNFLGQLGAVQDSMPCGQALDFLTFSIKNDEGEYLSLGYDVDENILYQITIEGEDLNEVALLIGIKHYAIEGFCNDNDITTDWV